MAWHYSTHYIVLCFLSAACDDFHAANIIEDGVYPIYPSGSATYLHVYCELCQNNGWTRIQRREDGSVDFSRDWAGYKNGFGEVSGEHWLGNDVISALTNQTACQLKVDLECFSGLQYYAQYTTFSVDDEANEYMLHVNGYSGTAGDSLAWNVNPLIIHDGMKFSTTDNDNDMRGDNAAEILQSGYWYNDVYSSNLNGEYWQDAAVCASSSSWGSAACIAWLQLCGNGDAIRRVTMKVGPK